MFVKPIGAAKAFVAPKDRTRKLTALVALTPVVPEILAPLKGFTAARRIARVPRVRVRSAEVRSKVNRRPCDVIATGLSAWPGELSSPTRSG